MVLAKSKNSVGLGNSLMNDRFGKGKGSDMRRVAKGIQRTAPDGQTYVITPKDEASWVKMRSVTEQNDLDEFLSTAELAGTDFTAEKMNNVKIIHRDQKNPYLLSAAEERLAIRKQNANKGKLKVPRRPAWDEHTTPEQLDHRERMSLLEWRRGLAEMQENDDLLMTPFERNLEVWRQLWRVIERSDLVVQIVDARNPLLFRCDDLEKYVKEVDPAKENLLLINKADMMTESQRQAWADYFQTAGIKFRFFSAHLAKDMNDALQEEDAVSHTQDLSLDDVEEEIDDEAETEAEEEDWTDEDEDSEDFSNWEATKIITTDELESLFLKHAPKVKGQDRKVQIGLVGYPNVGKSSTINSIIGAKKVSVSATPGKTKHFQTIHLNEKVVLCDCPGLVFPNFANTKAELVCNGVLPIDQMREFSGPATLVAQRIPQDFLEAVYGFRIQTRHVEEGGTGQPTGEELLRAYAAARGFYTTGLGQPDESRAARYVLKDYVNGKLLYCHPPPGDIEGKEFNKELYDFDHLPEKRRRALADDGTEGSLADVKLPPGQKTQSLDSRFFAAGQGNAGHLFKKIDAQSLSAGRQLSGRKLKTMVALEKDVDPADLRLNSKKHFKGNKRVAKKAVYNDV